MPLKKTSGAVLLVALMACSSSAQQPARPPSPSDVVATIGSTPVSLAELDEAALQQPASGFGSMKLSQALYEARRAALDELIGNRLIEQEARAKGVDRSVIVSREISAKVVPPGPSEIDAWFEANRGRLQGATIEQVREPIRRYLVQERTQAAREAYVAELRAKTPVKVLLEPPRLVVKSTGSPARGPESAPVQIVEFSDFQCPFCQRATPTIKRVLDTYGDRVRLVYRNYPLPNHPNARPAAEAAQCANEQGQFWAYHDHLFANPAKLADADLKQAAADLRLDTAKFNACFDAHQYKDVVDADVEAGNQAGVDGTPAFFINGRMLSGAQPFEAFKRIIDEEIQRAAR